MEETNMRLTLAVAGFTCLAAASQAAPSCTIEALSALQIPDITITQATPMVATATLPAFCDVQGTVVTKGAGQAPGSARFALQLPQKWEGRFLFLGVGGNAGNLTPSANPVDRAQALAKGYATILTDTGHIGDGTTAKWTRLPDGRADTAKMVDFFHRAAHDVTVAGKALVSTYYAGKINHAYFDGCSTGGRMALMEAARYPDDYDGVISGDPMMSFHTYTARAVVQKAALSSPNAYMSPALLAEIDTRVRAKCDAIDGLQDGLIQNPAACPVKAADLLCKPGETTACLNPDQMQVLKTYTSPFHDRHGKTVFGPWAITDLAGAQGVPFNVTGRAKPDVSTPANPWKADLAQAPRSWVLVQEMLTFYLGLGATADVLQLDNDPRTNLVGDKMMAMMKATYAEGEARDPAKLKKFLAAGRKLILYHGTSDPSIPASQSIAFYQELTKLHGAKLPANARLFLVPGMHHCGGGPGPDQFDTLSALEAWAERGQAPASIVASTKPDVTPAHRLKLCPYPQQARFSGKGDTLDPANWTCQVAKAG